jgi:hypothetical protein
MSDPQSNEKPVQFVDRLREEAFQEPDACAHRRSHQGNPNHCHLRQGRYWQKLHAGQSQLHDGAARQKSAAHWLRPQERHHQFAVRWQGLPDHHRNLIQEKTRR